MSQNEIIRDEKKLVNSPEPVSVACTKKILDQLIKCVFKINIGKNVGTGFFCKIPLEDNVIFNCLITNEHVLNEKYYKQNKKIDLLINDGNEIVTIDINMKRKTYFSEQYDITIIEIKENDGIKDFLELDEHLFFDKENAYYKNKSLYILQYPNGKIAKVSYGTLNGFNNYEVRHYCSTEVGSSGSPILNLETNKVIAIHKAENCSFNYNIGIFLKSPLIDFRNKINKDTKFNKDIKDTKDNKETKDTKDTNQISINIKKTHNFKLKDISKNIKNKNKDDLNKIDINSIDIGKNDKNEKNDKNDKNSNSESTELVSKKSKISVNFINGRFSSHFYLDYETTVDDMLNQYLEKNDKKELYGLNDKITFKYDSKTIKFRDKTPIGQLFNINYKNQKIPRIEVEFN